MSYRFADSLRAGLGRSVQVLWQLAKSQAVSKPVWHIPLLCVQWKTPDDVHRNCPKHAEFYSKNKFEKLVHLFGFIIRIYHDARSPERQSPTRKFRMWLYTASDMFSCYTASEIYNSVELAPGLSWEAGTSFIPFSKIVISDIMQLRQNTNWTKLHAFNNEFHWLWAT